MFITGELFTPAQVTGLLGLCRFADVLPENVEFVASCDPILLTDHGPVILVGPLDALPPDARGLVASAGFVPGHESACKLLPPAMPAAEGNEPDTDSYLETGYLFFGYTDEVCPRPILLISGPAQAILMVIWWLVKGSLVMVDAQEPDRPNPIEINVWPDKVLATNIAKWAGSRLPLNHVRSKIVSGDNEYIGKCGWRKQVMLPKVLVVYWPERRISSFRIIVGKVETEFCNPKSDAFRLLKILYREAKTDQWVTISDAATEIRKSKPDNEDHAGICHTLRTRMNELCDIDENLIETRKVGQVMEYKLVANVELV
jgi:hypothetical protein